MLEMNEPAGKDGVPVWPAQPMFCQLEFFNREAQYYNLNTLNTGTDF